MDKDSNCEGLRSHFAFLKEQGTRQRLLSERETCGKQSFRKIKLATVCVSGGGGGTRSEEARWGLSSEESHDVLKAMLLEGSACAVWMKQAPVFCIMDSGGMV